MIEVQVLLRFKAKDHITQSDVHKFVMEAIRYYTLRQAWGEPFHDLKLDSLRIEFPIEGRSSHVDI